MRQALELYSDALELVPDPAATAAALTNLLRLGNAAGARVQELGLLVREVAELVRGVLGSAQCFSRSGL